MDAIILINFYGEFREGRQECRYESHAGISSILMVTDSMQYSEYLTNLLTPYYALTEQ